MHVPSCAIVVAHCPAEFETPSAAQLVGLHANAPETSPPASGQLMVVMPLSVCPGRQAGLQLVPPGSLPPLHFVEDDTVATEQKLCAWFVWLCCAWVCAPLSEFPLPSGS